MLYIIIYKLNYIFSFNVLPFIIFNLEQYPITKKILVRQVLLHNFNNNSTVVHFGVSLVQISHIQN